MVKLSFVELFEYVIVLFCHIEYVESEERSIVHEVLLFGVGIELVNSSVG